ncbi:MAG: vanadium-dependent haloperoxidase [Pseudomonadota bacterium]
MKTLLCSLLSVVVAAGLVTAASAKEPAIQAWEERAYGAEDPVEADVSAYRLLTGLYLSMYLAGAEVDDRYDLNADLPSAEATPDEAAMAAGQRYLQDYFQTSSRGLGRVRRLDAREDLQALADAAAAKAFATVTATKSDPVPYRPFVVPGVYVPTLIPRDVEMLHLQHFAFDPARATEIAPPPGPDSDRYAESYKETKAIGGAKSEIRTDDQTKATMIYDLQDPHPMIFRLLARRDLSLFEQARIMAIMDMGFEDMTAAQFAGKTHFQSWRPITAIRNGDIDGRDDTEIDPEWTPLLGTPNTSEYPCGHCTFVSATAAMLEVLLPLEEGENVVILSTDLVATDNNRGFDGDLLATIEGFRIELDSYADYAVQGSESRIHNGAHFRYSTDMGQQLGPMVAKAVLEAWDGLPD